MDKKKDSFDRNDKIIIVKEFQSKAEHVFPYNEI